MRLVRFGASGSRSAAAGYEFLKVLGDFAEQFVGNAGGMRRGLDGKPPFQEAKQEANRAEGVITTSYTRT